MASELRDFQSATVAGAIAGNIVVAGIKTGDRIVTVVRIDINGPNLAAEFKATAVNTINNVGGTSSAAGRLLVQWEARHERGPNLV